MWTDTTKKNYDKNSKIRKGILPIKPSNSLSSVVTKDQLNEIQASSGLVSAGDREYSPQLNFG